ncbi:MAG: thioesterase family protein [Anaerolineae bacterium]|nr:thioesterase family protein [Anaerolineae bacterium]
MSKTPVVYTSTHRIKFSELDPYNHMRTAVYSAYYVDHRMDGLREHVGWDVKTLAKLPFMIWIRQMEIDFLRSVVADQEITITSFVREFHGPDAHIECSMIDEAGKTVSRCLMVVAYIDKNTNRTVDWPADTMALFFEDGRD